MTSNLSLSRRALLHLFLDVIYQVQMVVLNCLMMTDHMERVRGRGQEDQCAPQDSQRLDLREVIPIPEEPLQLASGGERN